MVGPPSARSGGGFFISLNMNITLRPIIPFLVAGYLSYRMILGFKKHGATDLEVPTRFFLERIATNGQAML